MTDEPKKIIRKKFKPSDVPNPTIGDLPPVAKKRGANDGPIFSPENQAFLDRLDDKPGDSATLISVTERIQSSIGRARMHKINAGKKSRTRNASRRIN